LNKKLGVGQYGNVYKGVFKTSSGLVDVAVKVITEWKARMNEDDVLREINSLSMIHCQNVVMYYGTRRTENNLYLIIEHCTGETLFNVLAKSEILPEDEALHILKQITRAFIHMSSLKDENGGDIVIVHRDLKPENIMFKNGIAKIIDFGFSKIISKSDELAKMNLSMVGTRYYVSPQILDDTAYSTKNDVWSAGIILYEMLMKKKPWEVDTNDADDLYHKIVEEPLKIPEQISSATKSLLLSMLKVDEENRLSWAQVWAHPALNKNKM